MSEVPVQIVEVTEVTPALVEAFGRLVPQLSSSNPPPGATELEAIVASPACHLLVAFDGEEIIGTLTLVVFPIPTGTRAWIEDVVVDESSRGRREGEEMSAGEALNRQALDLARRLGARTVDLTSRPSRGAANRLYQRIGFELRDTNVYRFTM